MRHKSILFIVICFLSFSLFATPITSVGETTSLGVSLDLNEAKSYAVGFSKTSLVDSDWTTSIEDAAETSLSINNFVGEGKVYVYWRIISPEKLQIKLSLADPLKNSDDESLDWTASWDSKTIGSNSEIKENVVFTYDKSSSASSQEIMIKTDNIAEGLSGTFTGKLTLTLITDPATGGSI